jgi:hypothetical protein
MKAHADQRRAFRIGLFAAAFCALFSSGTALAGPKATIYSDVRITYAAQTFGFSGVQTSFTMSQDGGRVVFGVTTVDTPGYMPLPQIDTSILPEAGNHWEVVTKVGNHTYTFFGTCAAQTFTIKDANGAWVRYVFLNCKDLTSNYVP